MVNFHHDNVLLNFWKFFLEMKAKDLADWWDMVQDMFQEDLKAIFQKFKLDENM
jgi:hypothetical protein